MARAEKIPSRLQTVLRPFYKLSGSIIIRVGQKEKMLFRIDFPRISLTKQKRVEKVYPALNERILRIDLPAVYYLAIMKPLVQREFAVIVFCGESIDGIFFLVVNYM
jgi:hypothetical protein